MCVHVSRATLNSITRNVIRDRHVRGVIRPQLKPVAKGAEDFKPDVVGGRLRLQRLPPRRPPLRLGTEERARGGVGGGVRELPQQAGVKPGGPAGAACPLERRRCCDAGAGGHSGGHSGVLRRGGGRCRGVLRRGGGRCRGVLRRSWMRLARVACM